MVAPYRYVDSGIGIAIGSHAVVAVELLLPTSPIGNYAVYVDLSAVVEYHFVETDADGFHDSRSLWVCLSAHHWRKAVGLSLLARALMARAMSLAHSISVYQSKFSRSVLA